MFADVQFGRYAWSSVYLMQAEGGARESNFKRNLIINLIEFLMIISRPTICYPHKLSSTRFPDEDYYDVIRCNQRPNHAD